MNASIPRAVTRVPRAVPRVPIAVSRVPRVVDPIFLVGTAPLIISEGSDPYQKSLLNSYRHFLIIYIETKGPIQIR